MRRRPARLAALTCSTATISGRSANPTPAKANWLSPGSGPAPVPPHATPVTSGGDHSFSESLSHAISAGGDITYGAKLKKASPLRPVTLVACAADEVRRRHPVTDFPLQCRSLQASITRSVIDASAFF